MKKKILFIDRDGTLIVEPADKQIDNLEKFALFPNVIYALSRLQQAGFILVMVSNQDGLGTESFPHADFLPLQQLLLTILDSQGIKFESIRICPHFASNLCDCRKPKLGLIMDYIVSQQIDLKNSYVIGDRETDLALAENMGIDGIRIGTDNFPNWEAIANHLLMGERISEVSRKTNETSISSKVNLDKPGIINIHTGIGFFDHMLEQLAKHSGISLTIEVSGDLHIDEHHTVEDTALVLGEALRTALGDKLGIARYGFLLPMDEAQAKVAIDLSGRPYCTFSGNFSREFVGNMATELVPHFFHSLAMSLKATVQIEVQGDNAHHMIEAVFKGFGRAFRQAIFKESNELPSTKGIL